ncbi:MAG: hypothetical protein ACFCVK_16960 [Acidimicrobiales bacterium]
MLARHPSHDTLRHWLSGDADDELDDHLDNCPRCAAVLEQLDTSPDLDLVQPLAQVLASPEGLTQRLETGVAARLSSRDVLNVVGDLFAAGFETTRLLLTEEPDVDR